MTRNHIVVMPADRAKKIPCDCEAGYRYDIEVPYEKLVEKDGKRQRVRDFDREYHMELPAGCAAVSGNLCCARIPQEAIHIKSWRRSDGKDYEEFDESPMYVEVFFIKDSERRDAQKKRSVQMER